MNYSKLVALTFAYFHLCGLCTFTANRRRWIERILPIWTAVHAAILATISTFVIVHPSYVFFDNDPIGALTDIIQVAAPFAAHFTNLAEACRTRRTRIRLRRLLYRADQLLCHSTKSANTSATAIDLDARNASGMRQFLRKACAMQALCVSTEIRVISAIGENREWYNLWSATLFTMIAMQSQHLLYIWHVDEVKWRLAVCAKHLQRIAAARPKLPLKDDDGVAALQQYHADLWLAAGLINQAFGWCALTTVTANFVCLSVNLYWNFVALYFGSNPFWKESLMGSVPLIASLWVLCWSCEGAQQKSLNIGPCVHQIRSNSRSYHQIRQIRGFSLQLQHLSFGFNGRGFFNINFDLFKGIIAAIATYMLIFIQFMPFEDVFAETNAPQTPPPPPSD